MELGKAIAKYRKDRGLSQKELAKRSGISEVYLELIEEGKKKPHIKTIARIASSLEVGISEMIDKF